MSSWTLAAVLLACVLAAAGCAFAPRPNGRLDEARQAMGEIWSDPRVARLAPRELSVASDALAEAESARNTLDDPALIDHLAYVAKQRAAIAREAALQRSSGR